MRILMSVTTWDGARVEAGLREFGFLTTVARDGLEIFECLDLLAHPVVLLETDVSEINWKIALRQLREEQPDTSILVIENKGDIDTTLAALEGGADDVIDPHMRADEVVSRILSVAARRAGYSAPMLRIGALKVDLRARRVTWGQKRVKLSPSQYEIFEMLCLNRTSAVTKDDIMGQLYGIDDGPDPRVIDVFLCKLRAKLVEAGAPEALIETVRGRGFRLGTIEESRGRLPLPFSDKKWPFDLRNVA